ncbi:MAG: hypothetical protein ING75_02450 [Rhodocyclaceae bacterium]|nr:hypothetical protein [Rhodocyclaceae bacterium]
MEHAHSVTQAIAVIGPQLRIAQSEIGRMKGIIDTAATELLSSFGEIQGVFRAVDNGQFVIADAALSRAMTALQFQDMVGQLMTGLSERIGMATHVLDHASRTGEASTTSEVTEQIHTFPRQVVLQHDVASGDIELF